MQATDEQTADAIKAVNKMVVAGIAFIPMPVLNNDDGKELMLRCIDRLDIVIAEAIVESSLTDSSQSLN